MCASQRAFGFSSHTHRADAQVCVCFVRCSFANGNISHYYLKLNFPSSVQKSHFAQLSLAQNSNLHRFAVWSCAMATCILPLAITTVLCSRLPCCRFHFLRLTFAADFHALSQFANSFAFRMDVQCGKKKQTHANA